MERMYELPAYLVWGFLESGKSTLIKETLSQDYFNDGEKTMILTFEEGEVEYDKEMLVTLTVLKNRRFL